MNNFTSSTSGDNEANKKIPKHLESLTTSIFQSLFPPIAPQTTPLSSIRRVLLLNREPTTDADDGTYTLNLRHYAITTKRTGLSRPLRRLNAAEKLMHSQQSGKSKKGGLPNLGKLEDIADYMIGGDGEGYMTDATSGSEVETDAEVEMLENTTRRVLNNKAKQRARAAEGKNKDSGPEVEKRAVKLVELGPRMKLRMTKVEEGVCGGKVMWHEYLNKTKEEMKALDKKWEQRRQEKERRKREQKENVEKKKKAKGKGAEEDDDEDDEMVDEWDSEGLEDNDMEEGQWEDDGEEEEEEEDDE
jgi:ribosome biogenesis protein SSF1/2